MRSLRLNVFGCCLLTSLLVSKCPAQNQNGQSPTIQIPAKENRDTTLHAESRLVLVDVVVSRHHGEPVHGLTAPDFVLLEDGKLQKIAFFEEHRTAKMPARPASEAGGTPGEFTNAGAPTPSSLNVILFDTLNTPLTDQPYAREQMIQFLKTLPRGYHLALFELGARLHMLSGYNQTSEELVATARKLVPHGSHLLETDEDAFLQDQQFKSMSTDFARYDPQFFSAMRDFMIDNSSTTKEHRLRLTLQGLSELTRAMSGFRGRKNVIWLSEYFPVSFSVLMNDGRFSDLRSYSDVIRQTSSTLSSAQVALYPIDVRGLTSGFYGNASLAGGAPDNFQEVGNIETRHIGMDDIAQQTGGHAYYNTNDLKFAMQRSLQNGSSYYTLAYVPPGAADSKYHRIFVHLVPHGLNAEHRKGYFAMPPQNSSRSEIAEFTGAVQPATPVSNGLLLSARVQFPDERKASTGLTCTIQPQYLTFVDQPNSRKAITLHIMTVAWDGYLNSVTNLSKGIELRFSPEQYQRVLQNGISIYQELRLKAPGRYDVRVAVMDDGSNRIGSLDVPIELSAPAHLAAR